jgi:ABC-type polysaccharide/polyol phosphate export permease
LIVPLLLGGPAARATAPMLLGVAVGNVGLLGTLFALNGISSTDRQRGYYRFLFAKPVGVPRFYAQDFLVRFVGLMLVAGVVFGAFALLARSPYPVWPVAHLALTYALVGSVGFLLSAITHHDGIALVLVYVGTTLVRAGGAVLGWAGGGVAELLQYLSLVLPPFHLLDALRDALAAGAAPRAGDLVWALAYGAGCFATGLLVLRHRPLST